MYLGEIESQKNALSTLFFEISTRLAMKEELKENSGGLSTQKKEGPNSIIVSALELCFLRWKLSIWNNPLPSASPCLRSFPGWSHAIQQGSHFIPAQTSPWALDSSTRWLNTSAGLINWLLQLTLSEAGYFLESHREEEKQWDKRAEHWVLGAPLKNGPYFTASAVGCAAPCARGMGGVISHSFGSRSNFLIGLQAKNRFALFGWYSTSYVTAFIVCHGCRNVHQHRGLLINHFCSGLWATWAHILMWFKGFWSHFAPWIPPFIPSYFLLPSPTMFWFSHIIHTSGGFKATTPAAPNTPQVCVPSREVGPKGLL